MENVRGSRRRPQLVAMALIALTSRAAGADRPTFHTFEGNPHAVSADGRVAVGRSERQAFRWTPAGGLELLGHLPEGIDGSATSVSADGSVIAGDDLISGAFTAFRWENGVMSPLTGAVPPGTSPNWRVERVWGMSADGSTIVGGDFFGFPAGSGGAFRWTAQDGFMPIPAPSGFVPIGAGAVTPDGRVVGGGGTWGGGSAQPFVWSEEGGTQIFDTPAGYAYAGADHLSADGSVFASSPYEPSFGSRAFRWKQGAWEDLGDIDPGDPSSETYAYAISADGRIVVGSDVNNARPFVWIEGRGMLDLQSYLVNEHGVDLAGHTLRYAFDMTPDARTFVGLGLDPQGKQVGWVVTIPAPAGAGVLALAGVVAGRRRRRGG